MTIKLTDLKLFWLIRNDQYYPSGGLRDVISTHYTYDEALAAEKADREKYDSQEYYGWHIEDVTDKVIPREHNPEYKWKESY